MAWKERLNKEHGTKKRYIEKAYHKGFDKKGGPWLGIHDLEGVGYQQSSYPAPYTRQNQDRRVVLTNPGFVNDSSATNPSDPSSMADKGFFRNSTYTFAVTDLPDGKKLVQSKVPSDWNNSGEPLNKAFYSFGSKTNIR